MAMRTQTARIAEAGFRLIQPLRFGDKMSSEKSQRGNTLSVLQPRFAASSVACL